MKPIHTKKDLRQFSQGSNFDANTEFLGASEAGEDINKLNMRHDEFDKDAVTKIGGEELVFPAVNNACFLSQPYAALSAFYECIGTANFFLEDDKLDHVIEFWTSSIPGENPFFRIDGIIVAMSVNIPLTYNHPLQIALNLSCIGGEIYITDYNVSPMIFNLKDLMVNGGMLRDDSGNIICTQKYFSAFNIDEYVIQLSGDNNHPIFIQITTSKPPSAEAIGTGGNDVGLYTYQIRKVTAAGDKTGWSKATPLIPVITSYRNPSSQYPYTKSYAADPGNKSSYGVHIRFRVDNAEGYDFLEIKRTKYTLGSAPGTPGVEKLLDYRLQLQPDDNFVKDIWDIGSAELPLDDQTAQSNLSILKRAKAIRYYNSRLVYENIEFVSRDIDATFEEVGGKKMFPVIQKMTTATRLDGHKNPYNFAYYRKLLAGEKYGWAAEFRDGNNQVSFAIPVPGFENYQMPNRRDVAAPETLQFSNGTVKAASVNGTVDQTHEVFDTIDTITKTAQDVKNVLTVVPYLPFHPVSENDNDVTGHNYQINTIVDQGNALSVTPALYNPKGFGLNYFSLGMALAGITSIPSYIKSISIVRTKPAHRVVAQGVAHYDIGFPDFDKFNKNTSTFLLYSPDFDSGVANIQNIIDDIAAGGTRYKVQCVSPLGFFSEVYNFNTDASGSQTEFKGMDFVHYLRVLRENGSINPGDAVVGNVLNDPSGVGLNGADGFGYTGFGKWRRRTIPTGGQVYPAAANGNRLFDISAVTLIQGAGTISSRFPIYSVTLGQQIFDFQEGEPSGSQALNGFFDPLTQNWHEPMYIVNVIDTLADVPQTNNIQNYLETEHYQKTESNIGISTGANKQEYLTVDERPEDFQNAAGIGSTQKVVFVSLNNVETVWMNIDGLSPAAILGIVNSINNGTQTVTFNGVVYNVSGVYQTTVTPLTDTYNEIRVVFDVAFKPSPIYPDSIFVPPAGSQVIIKYDTTEPMKAFGGESTIHEAVFSPYDLSMREDGNNNPPFFPFPAPFPYIGYALNNSYIRPNNVRFPATITVPPFEAGGFLKFLRIIPTPHFIFKAELRQMLCMFTCESRIGQVYGFESQGVASQNKFFPATHYIPRPHIWDASVGPTAQTVPFAGQYIIDYPSEETLWGFGGFRYRPQTNLDYTAQDETHTAVSKPKVGFTERTLFCTGGVFSLQRPPNVVNAPGLRTFPATNFFVIDDSTGDIKYAWEDLTELKGRNLYSITENGIFLLITDKTILSTLTGEQLAAIGSTGGNSFISNYIPISKTIGMNDEFWRSAAEGYNVIKGDLSFRRVEALFFGNRTSQYRLSQGAVFDIARGGKYHSKVFPDYLDRVSPEYGSLLSAVYDILHDEYWMCAKNRAQPNSTVVYAEKKDHYDGIFSYEFDKFTSFKGITYGMRNAETYLLNQYGQQINGADIVCELAAVTAKDLPDSKEFARIRISSNEKPDNVKVYNNKTDFVQNNFAYSEIDTAALPLSLKDYGAWEGFIPRKVNGARNRNQGREAIFVIQKTGNTKFKIVTVEIGYNLLK